MSIVTSGIKNSNESTLTGVLYATAIENTRRHIYVNRVLYCIEGLVCIRNNNSTNAVDSGNGFKILVSSSYSRTVNDVNVVVLDLFNESRLVQAGKHLALVRNKLVLEPSGCRCRAVLPEGHTLRLIRACVLCDKGILRERDDYRNLSAKLVILNLLDEVLIE